MSAIAADIGELAFMQFLQDNHILEPTPLTARRGRWAGLQRMMFTWAIMEGRIGDFHSYDDRWCFATEAGARAALAAWADAGGEGEPEGWHRHPGTGRRRPGGDVEGEYIGP